MPWAQKLFYELTILGAGEFIYLFALYAVGGINEGAMLSALADFFSQILSEIIAVFWTVDAWQKLLMIVVY